jgi:hypothetical protein
MFLTYFTIESLLDILKDIMDIKMTVSIIKGDSMDLEVQSCGYRWIYKQDHASLQKFLSSEL